MIQETKKLREDKIKAIADARAILDLATKEKRDMTPEEEVEYTKYFDKATSLDKKIDRVEKLWELSEAEKSNLTVIGNDDPDEKKTKETPEQKEERWYLENRVMNKVLRLIPVDNDKEREIANKIYKRAQGTSPGSVGGFLIIEQWANLVDIALKLFGGMRQVAHIEKHAKGGTFNWPMLNNTGRTGRWLAENTTVTKTDVAFTNKEFKDYTASSDLLPVSLQLMEDESFDLTSLITEALGEALGRLTNIAYTTGNGSGKPTGVASGSIEGKVSALSSAITFDELSDLKFSLDPAYRTLATWMFNDNTLKAISKLKDSDGQYLWNANVQVGVPQTLLGSPFVINQDVDSIGLYKKPIFYGNFKKYVIRDVGSFGMTRLNERYADDLQVAFMMHMRTDGNTLNAGTDPIKHMRNPNT